jgi:hypothetical protein
LVVQPIAIGCADYAITAYKRMTKSKIDSIYTSDCVFSHLAKPAHFMGSGDRDFETPIVIVVIIIIIIAQH